MHEECVGVEVCSPNQDVPGDVEVQDSVAEIGGEEHQFGQETVRCGCTSSVPSTFIAENPCEM